MPATGRRIRARSPPFYKEGLINIQESELPFEKGVQGGLEILPVTGE